MPVFSPGDLERLPEWVLLYLDGQTLRQVAAAIGVSHQTVSNRLTDLGITARYRAAYQEYRLAVEVLEHGPAIRTLFLSMRTTTEIAEDLSVSEAVVVASLDDEWPDWRILDSTRKQTPKRYSSDELRQCLLDAAAVTAGVLSTTAYDSFVAAKPDLGEHRPRPGKQAMMLRFGGWNAALRSAGLPTNPKSGPARRFDDPVAMLLLLVRCWDDLGKPPTVDDYGRWQKGKPEAPSPATARRLLESWPEARIQAWQVRHGCRSIRTPPSQCRPSC